MNELNSKLSKICRDLILEQPFYGYVLVALEKKFSESIPTACVALNGINTLLVFNPTFWNQLTDLKKKGLVLHELGHIIYFHLTDYEHLKNKEVANISMDVYINCKIPRDWLPPGAHLPEHYLKQGVSSQDSTNQIYDKLFQAYNSDPDFKNFVDSKEPLRVTESGDGLSQIDHHWEKFKSESSVTKKLAANQIQTLMEEVANTISKQRGTVPSHIKNLLEDRKIQPAKFNWKAFVRRFINNTVSNSVKKNLRKKSKRFEEDFGIRNLYTCEVFFVIDSSGSVSNEEIYEFINELKHLVRCGVKVDYAFADTQLGEIKPFKKNTQISLDKRGGTDFNDACEYFNKNRRKYSCMIYLTDGEAPAPNKRIKDILWVLPSTRTLCDHLPGLTIKLS